MATNKIGHYTIVSELGRGGMGVVYKAHEESLNRYVAIKVLGEHLSEDPSFVTRFVREAQAAAALSHPNIIQIFFIGEDNGRHYFVMEYVDGQSLLAMVRKEGRIENPRAAQYMLQAANGLAAAHDKGFLHRDIKPANLMVNDRGLLKIADFGLALPQDAATRLTATGMLVGTPGYLSPEQCMGQQVDKRTDI
jgi:eukaryotic-like serine/threonine-protein kinase